MKQKAFFERERENGKREREGEGKEREREWREIGLKSGLITAFEPINNSEEMCQGRTACSNGRRARGVCVLQEKDPVKTPVYTVSVCVCRCVVFVHECSSLWESHVDGKTCMFLQCGHI